MVLNVNRALVRVIHSQFMPNKVLLCADGGKGQQFLRSLSVPAIIVWKNQSKDLLF
jgi:hypothetical protein